MHIVIVGAGLAGAKAAATLRDEGFDGRISLYGEEPDRPYERPPLSKGRLLGTAERDSVFVAIPDDVELHTDARVSALDAAARTLTLDGGEVVGYDKLLLATGSRPRRLDLTGADLDGVHYLRTLPDSDRLAESLRPGSRVVVIGGGWIGLEVAAAARTRGASVSVVETLAKPLQRVLGDELADVFLALHRAHGVDFHLGASVSGLRGDGHVTGVALRDGTVLDADVVVVGVGIAPNVELAGAAGLTVDNGVVTDQHLRTSDPAIYAAGDVASSYHPLLGRHLRVEHWANALNGGPAAARAMLGQDMVYDRLPYFFSDQYDLGMEYAGHAGPADYDRVVFRGDPDGGEFVAFWLAGDRVQAGMNVNVWDVQDDIQKLVRAGWAGRGTDAGKLADPGVPLADLAD